MHIMTDRRKKTFDEAFSQMTEHGKLVPENYKNYNAEDFYIDSPFGYRLHAVFIPAIKEKEQSYGKKRVAVCVHGWTSNYLGMCNYADMYLEMGFSVVLYDHRNHLLSGGDSTTMGAAECDDLEKVINEVRSRMGSDIIIGTHGESMGAATVMMHAGKYKDVDFTIEDCGYSDLPELLRYQCKKLFHLPIFPTLLFAGMIFKKRTGYRFRDIVPSQGVRESGNVPMYFVHGGRDTFVPTYMVYKNYNEKTEGVKKLTLYDEAEHAASIIKYKDEYKKNTKEFLETLNI